MTGSAARGIVHRSISGPGQPGGGQPGGGQPGGRGPQAESMGAAMVPKGAESAERFRSYLSVASRIETHIPRSNY